MASTRLARRCETFRVSARFNYGRSRPGEIRAGITSGNAGGAGAELFSANDISSRQVLPALNKEGLALNVRIFVN